MWDPLVTNAAPDFWPPRPSPFWNIALAPLRRYYLKHQFLIDRVLIEGAKTWGASPQPMACCWPRTIVTTATLTS